MANVFYSRFPTVVDFLGQLEYNDKDLGVSWTIRYERKSISSSARKYSKIPVFAFHQDLMILGRKFLNSIIKDS